MEIEQLFEQAQARLRRARSEAYTAGNRRMAALLVQATHRLNEAEHELQYKALGHFWQWFYYPYGSRRAAGVNINDQQEYLRALPIEHRGMIGQDVAFKY